MFKELLLAAIGQAASTELSLLFEKFRQLNGEEKYNELILSIRNSFKLLQSVTDKTKTKIDDEFVKIVLDALPTL